MRGIKKLEQRVEIYCRRYLSITFQVICIMNYLGKVGQKNVQSFKVWLRPLLFIKMLLKIAQLFSNSPSIFPWSLSLYPLCYLFQKCNDTSAIPHSQATSVHYFVYVFPIFFRYHKGFNNCHLSKNLLTYKFFHWSMCFFIVLLPWRNGVVGFCLKWNNEATSCD